MKEEKLLREKTKTKQKPTSNKHWKKMKSQLSLKETLIIPEFNKTKDRDK